MLRTLAFVPLVATASVRDGVLMDLHVLLAGLVLALLSRGMGPVPVVPSRWRAALHEFWNQQIHLHELYLNRHDVSGGDALDASALRGTIPGSLT
jgi:hypothetical protein